MKVQQDCSESVDALGRAIQILSSQKVDRPQAEALLQKMAVTVPGMSRVLAAFLQQKDTPRASAVAAYEFQSNHLIEMLEGLLDKFKSELNDVENEEFNKQHHYELEQLHFSNTIADSEKDRGEKAKRQLAEAKASLPEDERLLAEVTATVESKTQAYEANQKVLTDELEALQKATEAEIARHESGPDDDWRCRGSSIQNMKLTSLLLSMGLAMPERLDADRQDVPSLFLRHGNR